MRLLVPALLLSAAGVAAGTPDCIPDAECADSCAAGGSDDCAGCDGVTAAASLGLWDPSRPALASWDGTFESDDGPPGYDRPLSTNRPTFMPSVVPVGAGVFQVESGYTYRRHANVPYNIHQYPEINPRVGLLDWLEVFGRWSAANQVPTVGGLSGDSGTIDGAMGVKILVTPQRGLLPQFALQPEVTFPFRPVGTQGGGDAPWRPGGWGIYQWKVNEQYSVGGSTRLYEQLDTHTSDPYLQFAQSALLNFQASDRLTTFAEWFAYAPHGADTEQVQHYAQTGLLFRPTLNLQIDARVGHGLNPAADDFFTGAGVSARF